MNNNSVAAVGIADDLISDSLVSDALGSSTGPAPEAVLAGLTGEVLALQKAVVAAEAQWAVPIARVHPDNSASARNLIHYWAIRQFDLRDLQQRLAAFGLSSLGRCEPHVQATLDAISTALQALTGRAAAARRSTVGFADGPLMLRRRAVELFGAEPPHRPARIMVTLSTEAATDGGVLIRALVEAGMDLARVNCAHDDPSVWSTMIGYVRAASAATGRDCRIAMDLAGPKLRTGPLAPGPQVLKLHPERNSIGEVTGPAHCWLTSDDPASDSPSQDPALRVAPQWLAILRQGDKIRLHDARGAKRHLLVQQVEKNRVWARADQTAYIATGTVLRTSRGRRTTVGALPPVEQYLTLHIGDTLTVTRDCSPAAVSPGSPPRIGCTLGEAFAHVESGQIVHLDDAKISGKIIDAGPDQFIVNITHAAAEGTKLRAAKGINLPDTVLPLSALTGADRTNLEFAAGNADLVELSFVRSSGDVRDLLVALDQPGGDRLGIVLKIETSQAFENLPLILLTAMQRAHTGVMIARGDLASEVGYERLAELQEEILWLCEAAHLPVVWATQVLDQLARSGLPSRAEITDAAMGTRAECVMLNKGPHILEAVAGLDDILTRMTTHHDKKNSLMRSLLSWRLDEI